MTFLPLLIAASLIFTAGFVFGSGIAYRKGHRDGYLRAQCDLADDAALTETLRPAQQRAVSRWQ